MCPSGTVPDSAFRHSLREKALRFLSWIEDEVSHVSVLALQSHARRAAAAGVPLSEARAAELPAALLGGTAEDECPAYVHATPPAYLAFIGEAVAAPEAAAAAAAATSAPLAGTKRPRLDAAAGGAAAAAPAAAGAGGEGGAETVEEAAVFPAPPFSVWLPESQVGGGGGERCSRSAALAYAWPARRPPPTGAARG